MVSANNIADILVNQQFSSMEEYLEFTKSWLDKNGLKNTIVDDASGFSPKTRSTVSDLSLIGQLAVQNSFVKEIVNLKSTTLPNGKVKQSTNLFLDSEYGEVVGIKTGNTDEAKYVFVTAISKQNSPLLVGSIMQAPDRLTSQKDIISYIDNLGKTYKSVQLFNKDTAVLSINLPWKNNISINTKIDVTIKNIANKEIDYKIKINDIDKYNKSGDQVGMLTVSSELEENIFPLYLAEDYPGISPWWRLLHPTF